MASRWSAYARDLREVLGMDTPTKPDVRVGDIWQEVDKRFARYVMVMSTSDEWVRLRTCSPKGELPKGSRVSGARLDRFNGKRGGYVLHHRTDETVNKP